MNIPTEVYGRIAQHLYNCPITRTRLARVCRSAHEGIGHMGFEPTHTIVCVTRYKRPMKVYAVSSFTRDASTLMDYCGNGCCDVIVGDLCIRVRRYRDHCSVRMSLFNRGYHEYSVCAGSRVNISTIQFINWVTPGVIPESLQTPTMLHRFAPVNTLVAGPPTYYGAAE